MRLNLNIFWPTSPRAPGQGPLLPARRPLLPARLPGIPALLLLAALASPGPALAGERHTAWAYPPGAGPKGAVEVETWITGVKEAAHGPTESEYRLEIENGLTDDVSLDAYLAVLSQTPEQGLKFDAVQLSLRANLLPERLRPYLDLTGYFEIIRPVDWSEPWGFEAILIAGKAYGRFSWSVNLVAESELSSNAFQAGVTEWKGIGTAGWELTRRLWAGAELIGENDRGRYEVSMGPTVSVGLTSRSWLAVGPQFPLNGGADHLAVRAIFGIFF
jgi:hypothetical protein